LQQSGETVDSEVQFSLAINFELQIDFGNISVDWSVMKQVFLNFPLDAGIAVVPTTPSRKMIFLNKGLRLNE
jgi:hypothetical protein